MICLGATERTYEGIRLFQFVYHIVHILCDAGECTGAVILEFLSLCSCGASSSSVIFWCLDLTPLLFLFMQHFMEGHAQSGPISRLPLITISDANNQLRDVPVCQVSSRAILLIYYADFAILGSA